MACNIEGRCFLGSDQASNTCASVENDMCHLYYSYSSAGTPGAFKISKCEIGPQNTCQNSATLCDPMDPNTQAGWQELNPRIASYTEGDGGALGFPSCNPAADRPAIADADNENENCVGGILDLSNARYYYSASSQSCAPNNLYILSEPDSFADNTGSLSLDDTLYRDPCNVIEWDDVDSGVITQRLRAQIWSYPDSAPSLRDVGCTDIDACLDSDEDGDLSDPVDCGTNAACEDVVAPGTGYTCSCGTGYSGSDTTDEAATCIDTDGCSGVDCGAGATCNDVVAPGTGYTCSCGAGYSGSDTTDGAATCRDTNGCAGVDCGENATCVDATAPLTGYSCVCNDGYSGYAVNNNPATCTAISSYDEDLFFDVSASSSSSSSSSSDGKNDLLKIIALAIFVFFFFISITAAMKKRSKPPTIANPSIQ